MNISTHLIPVQVCFWTFLAHPMHKLPAAKGGHVGINTICSIALQVPFMQQLMLRCFKRGLLFSPCKSFVPATRTSAVVMHTLPDLSLPLMAADWALPFSPETTAGKHLLWCLGILVLVPILDLSRSLGSKRVVLAHFPPFTVWAFGAYCPAGHSCLPDMRASCWTIGA